MDTETQPERRPPFTHSPGLITGVQSHGDAVVLRVAGDIGLASAPQLVEVATAILDRRPCTLVVDMSRVSFLASLLYADDHETLSPSTNRLFEQEANQGAAELLFQRTRFTQDATDTEISIAAIWDLTHRYDSSFHAAIRRYAETHPGAVAAIVLDRTPSSTDPHIWARQEIMTTPAWTARFGPTRWPRMMNAHRYPFLAALTIPNLEHVRLTDNSGAPATVRVDTYQTPTTASCCSGYPNDGASYRDARSP